MTQEEKDLVLKDLCGRVLYKTIGSYCWKCGDRFDRELWAGLLEELINSWNSTGDSEFIPYLRPMSSMTKEEEEEYNGFLLDVEYYPGKYFVVPATSVVDWLNKNHFDFRGLIPMGLALEAPDGMYKGE